jgi:hypothetical protein
MPYKCPLCSLNPNSHSLTKIAEINDTVYFYTCPSQAILYYDADSIIKHYDGVFSEIPKNKKWIWIFNSLNFQFKHFMQFNVSIELAKLISNKFSENLQKIIIINPTVYISSTYNMINRFLNQKIRNIIVFNHKLKTINDVLKYYANSENKQS